MKIVPTPAEVAREALIVVGGAILAAFLVDQFPALKKWIKERWQ